MTTSAGVDREVRTQPQTHRAEKPAAQKEVKEGTKWEDRRAKGGKLGKQAEKGFSASAQPETG